MNYSKFDDLLKLSNNEISETIVETENELFKLKFRKATRQSFKSSDIKNLKRKIAQLKTLLTIRIEEKGEIINQ
jgi:ribosomal protein L29